LLGSGLLWFFVAGGLFTIGYFLATVSWNHAIRQRGLTERKVLMLTQHLVIGGLERMILNLSVQLRERGGWVPQVFVYDHIREGATLADSFRARGIPVELHEKPRGVSLKAMVRIARRVLDDGVQVIHSHDMGALIYGVGAKLLTLGRVRLVHTQHSFVHINRHKRYRHYERFFTLFADELVVVSDDTRARYVELGVSGSKIHVVPNGVSFVPAPSLDPGVRFEKRLALIESLRSEGRADVATRLEGLLHANWVLYMARVHGRKGQPHAVALWSCLDRAARDTSALVFVGPETEKGRMAELQGLVENAPSNDRIVIAGPSHEPAAWLEAASVFMTCSEFEGMPLGPIEGAGAGLPLVLSRIAGHEILSAVSHSFHLDYPQEGARALEGALAQGASLAGQEQLLGIARDIRAQYSLDAMSARYEAIYANQRRFVRLPLGLGAPETAGG
jgi:glycosyltransferase involved in cell wall biosynthesis